MYLTSSRSELPGVSPSWIARHDALFEEVRDGAPETIRQWLVPDGRPAAHWSRQVVGAARPHDLEPGETGGALAKMVASLRQLATDQGMFLELRLPYPETRGWGSAIRDEVTRQRAAFRCLQQAIAAVLELLEASATVAGNLPLVLAFEGDWTDSVEPCRRKLAEAALQYHFLATCRQAH